MLCRVTLYLRKGLRARVTEEFASTWAAHDECLERFPEALRISAKRISPANSYTGVAPMRRALKLVCRSIS